MSEKKKLGKLINSHQVIELLDISQAQFYAWLREGKLPYYRLGRKYMFDQNEIEELIQQSRVEVLEDPIEIEKQIQTLIQRHNEAKKVMA